MIMALTGRRSHYYLSHLLPLSFTLTLVLITHTSNAKDYFESFDCGLVGESSYKDEITGLTYKSDEKIIESGKRQSILPEYKVDSLERQFWYVRSFPEGKRNCYTFNTSFPSSDDSTQFMIRVRFMYGNYDKKNNPPSFDLYLGATFWDSVVFDNAASVVTKEIFYNPDGKEYGNGPIHVCLYNSNNGTPFISVLEARVLRNLGIGFVPSVSIMELVARYNLGNDDGKSVRYPNDVYDRIWTPYKPVGLKSLNTSHRIENSGEESLPPSIVMQTAATPANASDNITFSFPGARRNDDKTSYYLFLYSAEIQELNRDEIRGSEVSVDGALQVQVGSYSYEYLNSQDVAYWVDEATEWKFWIYRTNVSTLPPILNAFELYASIGIRQPQTHGDDYDAISKIKSYYGIKRNWQGDPCTPEDDRWEGLECDSNKTTYGNETYRIRSLNLSSRRLNGSIDVSISNLIFLTDLDLSNNNLTGKVPEFLSQLKHLRALNIKGNQLSGVIPAELIERSNHGPLQLRCDNNPGLLCPGPVNGKHKNQRVIAVAASLGGTSIIVVAAINFYIFFKKRRQVGTSPKKLGFFSNISQRLTLSSNNNKKVASNKQVTYAEILGITGNFEKVVGKGGFGTVYHGILGNTQVAVKVLSPSTQGYLQFQAEAILLTRVHHKCLTPLLGYCHEGTNIALIYEYMPNGDLANYLSDNEKLLSWKQRIQIAFDAAEGLEYLHDGCKPPIVHRDIKSRNILLNEKLRGKIADFGLSKIFPNEGDTHVFTAIAGTPGYLDPEYYASNRLNEKSDVFSFGVVLLELITGRPVIIKAEQNPHIIQWVRSVLPEREINDIVDSRLRGEFDSGSARIALDTAMACVAQSSINRPSMSQVVVKLRECLAMEITREHDGNGNTTNIFVESDNHWSTPMMSNNNASNSFDSFSVENSLIR